MATFETSRDRLIEDFLGQKHSCISVISKSSIIHVCNGQNTTCNFFCVWIQNGCKSISYFLLWSPCSLGAAAHCPAQHHERGLNCTSLAKGKDQNSKFGVWFLLNVYRFCIIVRSKNRKLNRPKSGTTYTKKKSVKIFDWNGYVFIYSSISYGFSEEFDSFPPSVHSVPFYTSSLFASLFSI